MVNDAGLDGFDAFERLLPTLSSVSLPVAVVDDGGTVLSATPAFFESFDISPAEGRGRPLSELASGAWSGADLTAGEKDVEVQVTLPRLGKRVLSISTRPLGSDHKALVAVHDVTDGKRADQRAAHFLNLLSHELRTPLAALLLHVELLRACREDAAQLDRVIAGVERSARAQAQMIDDLLDASRIAAGRLELERQPADLASLTGDALKLVETAAERQSLTLDRSIENVGLVLGDRIRLRHALWHIISNALKFTPKTGRVSVTLDLQSAGCARFVVQDTGIGVPPADQHRIFDPFVRLERTSRYGGMGLGLAIARHVIERHGGSLRVESVGEGKGTTVTVTLPVTAGRETGAEAPSENGLTNARVLVVEDDDATRQATMQILERRGAAVRGAPSADAARELLLEFRPSVLVCDIMLPPGEDGYSFVRWLRAEGPEGLRAIPAIALTARSSEEDRRLAADAGFTLHLPKPVDAAALTGAMKRLLKRGRS